MKAGLSVSLILGRGWQMLSPKSQILNTLRFVSHMISVATSQLCHVARAQSIYKQTGMFIYVYVYIQYVFMFICLLDINISSSGRLDLTFGL